MPIQIEGKTVEEIHIARNDGNLTKVGEARVWDGEWKTVWESADDIQKMGPTAYYKLNGSGARSTGMTDFIVQSPSRATFGPEHVTFHNHAGTEIAYFNTPDEMAVGNSFTIAGWINPDTLAGDPDFFHRASEPLALGFGYYTTDRELYVGGSAGSGWQNRYHSASLSTGSWHHVAVRFTVSSSSSTSYQIWLNGSSQGSGSLSRGPSTAGLASVYAGSFITGINPFRGGMDTVVYFDRALTTQEVGELYALGRT